jgi:hypothetical protein
MKYLAAAAIAAVVMAAPAQAATVIDFTTGLAGKGGVISWDGTNLIGSNIPVGAVAISGAPANNEVFEVTGTTTAQRAGFYGSMDFNTHPDNNFITISGCIADLSIGIGADGPCTPVALMTGTFTSWNTNGRNGLTEAMGNDM